MHDLDTLPDTAERGNPFSFERRGAERVTAAGPLQAVLANGRDMPWVMRLGLINASTTGLCVLHDAPLSPGARLSLRVDPVHGGWKTGTVVRCIPRTAGGADCYELGIAYEVKRQAA